MNKVHRMMSLAATVAALAVTTTPAIAAPVAASTPAQARARIIKPLSLTATGELNFGTIVIPAGGVTANRVISLSNLNVLDCAGGSAEVTCDPTSTTVPTYNVRGTQGQVVQVIKTASSLSGSNGGSLSLTPTGPATVTLTNSGAPGENFTIGGDITITSATVDGVYTGTVDVQVDYQ